MPAGAGVEAPGSRAVAEDGVTRPRTTLLVLAAAVVVLVGLHLASQVIVPLALALVLTVCAYPLRAWFQRRGLNGIVAAGLVVVIIWATLVALAFVIVFASIQFSELVSHYGDTIDAALEQVRRALDSAGVSVAQTSELMDNLTPSKIASAVSVLVGGLVTFGTGLVFLFTLILLLAVDVSSLGKLAESLRSHRPYLLDGLKDFSGSVREYLGATTMFGAVIALLDGITLLILGVPSPLVWVILAFVSNFVPNVGFLIGLLPPVLIALLAQGWQTALLLAVIYSAINIAIQSFVQPLFVGRRIGLNQTTNFLSLIIWSLVLGPVGAILAIPMTLFARAILVDADPRARWIRTIMGDVAGVESDDRSDHRRGHHGGGAVLG